MSWKHSLDHYITYVPEYEFEAKDEEDEELFSNCCGVPVYGEISDKTTICPHCLEHCMVVSGEDFDEIS